LRFPENHPLQNFMYIVGTPHKASSAGMRWDNTTTTDTQNILQLFHTEHCDYMYMLRHMSALTAMPPELRQ